MVAAYATLALFCLGGKGQANVGETTEAHHGRALHSVLGVCLTIGSS